MALCVTSVTAVVIIGAVYLMWYARNSHLMSKRDPLLAILTTVCIILSLVDTAFREYFGEASMPCSLLFVVNYLLVALIPAITIVHCIGLYARHLRQLTAMQFVSPTIQQHALQRAKKLWRKTLDECFLRLRLDSRAQLRWVVAWGLTPWLIYYIIRISRSDLYRSEKVGCRLDDLDKAFGILEVLLVASFMLPILLFLRHHTDSLLLRHEVVAQLVAWVPLLGWRLYGMSSSTFDVDVVNSAYAVLFGSLAALLATVWWPALASSIPGRTCAPPEVCASLIDSRAAIDRAIESLLAEGTLSSSNTTRSLPQSPRGSVLNDVIGTFSAADVLAGRTSGTHSASAISSGRTGGETIGDLSGGNVSSGRTGAQSMSDLSSQRSMRSPMDSVTDPSSALYSARPGAGSLSAFNLYSARSFPGDSFSGGPASTIVSSRPAVGPVWDGVPMGTVQEESSVAGEDERHRSSDVPQAMLHLSLEAVMSSKCVGPASRRSSMSTVPLSLGSVAAETVSVAPSLVSEIRAQTSRRYTSRRRQLLQQHQQMGGFSSIGARRAIDPRPTRDDVLLLLSQTPQSTLSSARSLRVLGWLLMTCASGRAVLEDSLLQELRAELLGFLLACADVWDAAWAVVRTTPIHGARESMQYGSGTAATLNDTVPERNETRMAQETERHALPSALPLSQSIPTLSSPNWAAFVAAYSRLLVQYVVPGAPNQVNLAAAQVQALDVAAATLVHQRGTSLSRLPFESDPPTMQSVLRTALQAVCYAEAETFRVLLAGPVYRLARKPVPYTAALAAVALDFGVALPVAVLPAPELRPTASS